MLKLRPGAPWQVRQKKEAAEREKRKQREEEVRQEEQVARYAAADEPPRQPHMRQPDFHHSPTRGRGGAGPGAEAEETPMTGQLGGRRPPWEADGPGGHHPHHRHHPHPHPHAGPPGAPPPQAGEGKARGRRVVNELRAGLSDEQQHRANAQNEELKREWERQVRAGAVPSPLTHFCGLSLPLCPPPHAGCTDASVITSTPMFFA